MFSAIFKLYMKWNQIKAGKHLKLKGLPFIYNTSGSVITIGEDCTIKSSFLSNLVGLYSRTIIVTRSEGCRNPYWQPGRDLRRYHLCQKRNYDWR